VPIGCRQGSKVTAPYDRTLGMNDSLPTQLQPTGKTEIHLPGGGTAVLPLCRPVFSPWNGAPIAFDYGKKPVLEHKGEPCFAELKILHLLLEAGWDGVWVGTYGGAHYLRSMPRQWNLKSESVPIPEEKELLLKKIWKAGRTRACFDVFAWQRKEILFCEAKQSGKDRLTRGQERFIEAALSCGVSPDQLLIVEWTTPRSR
jgi:hypothetical protein